MKNLFQCGPYTVSQIQYQKAGIWAIAGVTGAHAQYHTRLQVDRGPTGKLLGTFEKLSTHGNSKSRYIYTFYHALHRY